MHKNHKYFISAAKAFVKGDVIFLIRNCNVVTEFSGYLDTFYGNCKVVNAILSKKLKRTERSQHLKRSEVNIQSMCKRENSVGYKDSVLKILSTSFFLFFSDSW